MPNSEILKNIKEELNTLDKSTIVLENPNYVTAILGYTSDGSLVYDYELMIEFLVNNENMTSEEAEDFLNYNTLRAIPYMGKDGVVPTIVHRFLL